MADTAVREPLLGKKNRKLLSDPLNDNNPITVQVLGICSALAVTSTLANSIMMSMAVVAVTAFANLIIASVRNYVPTRVRMIVQLVVIASLVIVVRELLNAFAYPLYKELAVFVGLIITNCIIMGRLEAFAMGNKPWPAFLDGVGNGVGYGIVLIAVGFVREIFGFGTLSLPFVSGKLQVIPEFIYNAGYVNNGIMVLPLSSIFLIGIFIWLQRAWNSKLVDVS